MKIKSIAIKSIAVGATVIGLSACNPTDSICRPREVIVTEQYLDEGNTIDVHPPQILSYWPDLSKDDGTIESANNRCENSGGELIYYPLTGEYRCEDIDY